MIKNIFKDTDLLKALKYLLIAIALTVAVNCSAQEYKIVGKNYIQVKKTPSQAEERCELTGYTWTDSKGVTYPIWISKNGSCFVNKISSKTGNQYKYYLKAEIADDICKKLGREKKKTNLITLQGK